MDVTYIVPKEALAPVEVRAFLRQNAGFSHGLWRRLKWNGLIEVNGQAVKATMAVAKPGDTIHCVIPEASSLTATPMALDIRYEDDTMIILNKPPGILVHPTGGHLNTLGNNGLNLLSQIGNHNRVNTEALLTGQRFTA